MLKTYVLFFYKLPSIPVGPPEIPSTFLKILCPRADPLGMALNEWAVSNDTLFIKNIKTTTEVKINYKITNDLKIKLHYRKINNI